MPGSAAEAIRLSLIVATWCAVLGLPVAVVLGHWLAHARPVARLLSSVFIALPLVLPPVVTGLLLLRLFGRHGVFAAFGMDSVAFTKTGAILAAFVVSLPLSVAVARNAFASIDDRYAELARSLGRTPWRTFVTVTLPMALPGVLAGAVLSFARALGEFGATIVLAGNVPGETQTISLAVYSALERPDGDQAVGALLAASIGLSVIALVAYELVVRWQDRRLEVRRG